MILFESSWGSIPDWLMLGVTTAAVAASIWFGVKGRLDGDRERGLAWDAVEQSRKDTTISRQEQAFAREAHKTSVESADAARRSAAAAEAAEERQKVAEARQLERHEVDWKFDRIGDDHSLKNLGPHDATDVTVTVLGAGVESIESKFSTIKAGETVVVPLPGNWILTQAVARVHWLSPLGVPRDSQDLKAPDRAYFF